MSRVSENTAARRAVAATLILLTSATFAACGGSESSEDAGAAAPTSTTTTPAQTSPPADPGTSNGTAPRADGLKVDTSSKFSDTPETKATIAKANKKKSPAPDATLKKQADKALAALKSDGFNAASVPPFGDAKYAVKVGSTTALFYASPSAAARDNDLYEDLIENRPGYGRAARDGSHGYLANAREKLTDAEIETFRSVRAVVEGAL